MDINSALVTLATEVETANTALASVAVIIGLVNKLKAEGRTEFTPEEWAPIDSASAAAKERLLTSIARALNVQPMPAMLTPQAA